MVTRLSNRGQSEATQSTSSNAMQHANSSQRLRSSAYLRVHDTFFRVFFFRTGFSRPTTGLDHNTEFLLHTYLYASNALGPRYQSQH